MKNTSQNSDRYKRTTLTLLTIAFLCYSLYLYTTPNKEKDYEANTESLQAKGKQIWQQKNCTSCHQIYGLGGHLGPDLTNVVSQRPQEYIEFYLKNGSQVMPNFNLSQDQIDALISFLTAVDQSGQADPRTFKLYLDGTISQ